jgi:hypothetical protein
MSQDAHPFLRIEILKFQISNNKQPVDLSKVKTEIEIKEKNQSTQSCMSLFFYSLNKNDFLFLISTNKKTGI